MHLHYTALDSDLVRALRDGAPDANGQPPERGAISDGQGVPCRHCLRDTPAGREYLILAHRPFPAPQPYAEQGPIFLCADDCSSGSGSDVPAILKTSPDYLVKGYGPDHRIRYGTGRIVAADKVPDYAEGLLADPTLAFVDVRSARNNCHLVRITRR
jgi:hypothetical protein